MNLKQLLCTSLLVLSFTSHAGLVEVASDNANNYGNDWAGNGGTGFDAWSFAVDNSTGFAGKFLANKSIQGDLNHIASNPTDNAWGTFANGGGFNQIEAYRGFAGNSLDSAGDQITISMEHGAIVDGGSVGFTLRNQNDNQNVGDYNNFSRFEFTFLGGLQTYTIFDGTGRIDTGIGFTDAGLNLVLSLLDNDGYKLNVFNAFDGSLAFTRMGTLMGSGTIDSIALYNRDAELANAYFNNLSIKQNVVMEASAPAFGLLCLLSIAGMFLRRSN